MSIRGSWMRRLLPLIVAFALHSTRADTCAWQTCPEWSADPSAKNIHFIPHSHDDMGWLKTADDYYTGNRPIQNKYGVQYIINTVVQELLKDPSRKFSYCETGFLTRWLEDKDQASIDQLIALVKSGQMELIGGGWVQPDEAATHYIELLDMYTVGLRKLQSVFGDTCGRPRTGWQIDPFGHSREHANLLSLMGYESVYFAREDFREHINRRVNKKLEFNWFTSDDNPTRTILGAVFPDHYQQPSFMNFDIGNDKSVPVIDDPELENYNVDSFAHQLAVDVNVRSNIQPHNHYIYMMGSDFHYSDANHYFSNMDRLIKYVNREHTMNMTIQYSTPACYTQAVKASNTVQTNKTYDFFPYANDLHNYWTGYFTSKPALKGVVRSTSNMLNVFRQVIAFAKNPALEEFTSAEDKLERALGLSLHHDAVTGTSKEHVTQNYEKRIFDAYGPIQTLLQQSLARLNNNSFPQQEYCLQMNESVCAVTNSNSRTLAVTVFNGHSQATTQLVRIPLYFPSNLLDPAGNPVYLRFLSSTFAVPNQINNTDKIAPRTAYFSAELPANGYVTYFLTPTNGLDAFESNEAAAADVEDEEEGQPKATSLSNGILTLQFDAKNKVSSVLDKRTNLTYALSQDFLFYEGHDNVNGSRASGAYIFRPQVDGEPAQVADQVALSFADGGFPEARQVFSDYVSQAIRLVPGKDYIEFEWTIGPIPIRTDGLLRYGKEIVTRYTVPEIANNETFYTDANGRQMMKRKLFHNPDFDFGGDEMVAGNFYPVNTRAYIQDSKTMMVVLTDRSQGVSSINLPPGKILDGSLQFMLHRRDMYDDGKGVSEPLSEPGRDGRGLVVRGIHRVFIGDPQTLTTKHRQAALELYHQPVVSLAAIDTVPAYLKQYPTTFSGVTPNAVPVNVHIVTLKHLSPGKVLLRLEHIYATNEDPVLSKPATVDLTKIFSAFTVTAVQELALASNGVVDGSTSTTVTLNPQDIKAFLLSVS